LSSLSCPLELEYLNWQGLNFRDDAVLACQLSRAPFTFALNVLKYVPGQLAIDTISFTRQHSVVVL